MKKKLNSLCNDLLTGIVFLLLNACGAGGDVSFDSSTAVMEGRFIDAPVSNLYFESETLSGATEDNGAYTCFAGKDISFYLQDLNQRQVYLGHSRCRPIISPIDLVSEGIYNVKTDLSDMPEVQRLETIRLLRILQSLDMDLNPRTGITLSEKTIETLIDHLDQTIDDSIPLKDTFHEFLRLESGAFEDSLNQLMSEIGRENQAISAEDAVLYFNEYRDACSEADCPGI